MYPPCFRTEGRLTSIEALARPVAVANDRQGERKIDDVERQRSGCQRAGGGKIRVTRSGRTVPLGPCRSEGGPAAVFLSSANTSWLFENMLLTTANSIQVLCSAAGG